MSFGPIQLLDFCIDPTAEALLSDDGLIGATPWGFMFDVPGVGITDISEGGGLGSGGFPDPRHSGHYVRRGGSGVHRNKGTKVLPHAVDDTLSVSVGDSATNVDVLANDTYAGTPTIVILSGPNLDGASARVVGHGASSRIQYTPPATGYPDGANDEVTYWLRATGNSRSNGRQRSQDTATLRVSVENAIPSPGVQVITFTRIECNVRDIGPYIFLTGAIWQSNSYQTALGSSIQFSPDGQLPGSFAMAEAAIDMVGNALVDGIGMGPVSVTFTSQTGGIWNAFVTLLF